MAALGKQRKQGVLLVVLAGLALTGCHSTPPQQPPGSPTAINSNGIPNAAQGSGKMPAVLQRDLQGGQRAPSSP
ncbi:hypothetical protein CWRG_01488 [Chthonomonas calidirosea]|nr:hypothetical protein CWRG_01488 [Chthonomonas calidirosea]